MAEDASRSTWHGAMDRCLAPHRPIAALAILACLLFLPSVWNRDLWNPDEPRYTEVSREMVTRGDYILPYLGGHVYGEKPPVYFWLELLAAKLPGVPFESGGRLVSVIAALGTLVLVFRLGRRLADAQAGWIAALVLATSWMFFVHASSGVIDGTLTFLVVAQIACGLKAREADSKVLWACFYLLAGVAAITKGPVGIAIPAGVLILLWLQERSAGESWAIHPAWGLLLVAGVASLWLIPAIVRGGSSYAATILWKQNVGRAYDSWHHKEPIHYFLSVFPASYLPWIVALPTALYAAFKSRRADRGARLGLTWFIFTFLFFSVISGKKTRYLLPLFPAASLLVALELRTAIGSGWRSGRPGRVRTLLPLVALGVFVALAGVGLCILGLGWLEGTAHTLEGLSQDQREALLQVARLPGNLALVLPGLILLGLGAAALVALTRDRRASLAWTMAGLLAMSGWTQWIAVPVLNHLKSSRPLAEAIEAAAGPETPVGVYRETYAGIFNFYLRRDKVTYVSNPIEARRFLTEPAGAVLILTRDQFEEVQAGQMLLQEVACRRIGADILCAARAGPGR